MRTTENIPVCEPGSIRRAAAIIKTGGLVGFPTDTVYGLAADVFNPAAVLSIYAAKERQPDKAIPILIAHVDQIAQIAEVPDAMTRKLAQAFWPGALTLVVNKLPLISNAVSSMSTIGIRMPDHPVALALLKAAGPLAVTSANISGGDNRCTAWDVLQDLEGRIDLILDGGQTPGGVPSTVLRCADGDWQILRPGPITEQQIRAVLD